MTQLAIAHSLQSRALSCPLYRLVSYAHSNTYVDGPFRAHRAKHYRLPSERQYLDAVVSTKPTFESVHCGMELAVWQNSGVKGGLAELVAPVGLAKNCQKAELLTSGDYRPQTGKCPLHPRI